VRKSLSILAIATIIVATGLTGCRIIGSGKNRATVLDPELRGMLEMETKDPKYNEAGQLLAQAQFRNNGPEGLHIMVQTIFLDVSGASLEPDTPWENKLIPEYSTIHYRKASLREGAVDFEIQVRKGRAQ
jgi:hypothetical protein